MKRLVDQKAKHTDLQSKHDKQVIETELWKNKHQKELIAKLKIQQEKEELAKKLKQITEVDPFDMGLSPDNE